jgi:hypothetical protein
LQVSRFFHYLHVSINSSLFIVGSGDLFQNKGFPFENITLGHHQPLIRLMNETVIVGARELVFVLRESGETSLIFAFRSLGIWGILSFKVNRQIQRM